MRKAFQRCSTSLPRCTKSSSGSSFSIANNFCLGRGIPTSTVKLHRIAVRAIHRSTRLQEAARAPAASSQDEAGNQTITRFEELETHKIVHQNVVRTLTRDMGLETMTEVQSATINEALKGTDIIAQAKTGTGKTLAFLLPILQNILTVDPDLAYPSNNRRGPRTTADDIRALIISPTRELAEQIAEEARKLVRNTGVIVQTAVGGSQKSAGLRAIQSRGCHLLVGTPGRLKDVLSDPYSRVEAPDLSALVFDEADRLLDQGFWPEIQEIMRLLPTPAEKDRQTLMFSATVPREVVDLVRSTLKPGFQFIKTVRDDEEPTHARVPQHIVTVNGFENKLPALVELCSRSIEASKEPGNVPFKAIVYYNSTAEVTLAASVLKGLQVAEQPEVSRMGQRRPLHPWHPTRVFDIHARLTQFQRTAAADAFRRCESGILLSSDVTARGMDFPNVTHVIQMAIPPSREQYIHRIGRTARAGKEGEGWLIVNREEAEEARYRLNKLPLQNDKSLNTATFDMTKEGQVPAEAGTVLAMVQQATRNVPIAEKFSVYKALLGVYGWLGNKRRLVESMNNLAKFGWGLRDPPTISPLLAQRLGLARIPGVNLGHDSEFGRSEPGTTGSSFGRGGSFGGRENRFGGRNEGRGGFGRGDRGSYGSDRFGGDGGSRPGGSRGNFGGDRYGRSRGGYGGERFGGDRERGSPRQRDGNGYSGERSLRSDMNEAF